MSRARRARHAVTVTIAGEKHVLRSDAPPDYTRSVAEHVDRTVRALRDAQPLEPHRTATLAALVITDELFRTRKDLEELREQLRQRAEALAARLERAARELPLQATDETGLENHMQDHDKVGDDSASGGGPG